MKSYAVKESDIFRFTSNPSSTPTKVPTLKPSSQDSYVPTVSSIPSITRSYYPSISLMPSDHYRHGYVPNASDTESFSYFNYNPKDSYYGPGVAIEKLLEYNSVDPETNNTLYKNMTYLEYRGNSWSNRINGAEYSYWRGFDINRTLQNRCQSDPWRKQSPIDLCEDYVNAECYEHHQIRNVVSLKISSSKLLRLLLSS